MTHPNPPSADKLTDSLNYALDNTIQNLFNNLISNLIAPTFSQDRTTPIERFERGFKIALDAYDQALAVIAKEPTK